MSVCVGGALPSVSAAQGGAAGALEALLTSEGTCAPRTSFGSSRVALSSLLFQKEF